ncbi:calcium/sodium antiporter [Oricola thermophila]|uniref:Calcium/sodium antiporter n=2 Tax=Oricola thermophila TaxID=2742145 RepID=A0A6N1VHY1_9HYPH|nr:calcium/sodium antiporter [Oricola thermophila]
MLIDIALVAVGLLALFAGGEWLVRGAVALAARLGLPTLIISLTVVGFGTSMPELLVSLRAALADQADIALGNVVGSNTANILLIIGLSALVSPMTQWDNAVKRDAVVMVCVALVALTLVQFAQIGRPSGLLMVTFLATYLAVSYIAGKKAGDTGELEETPDISSIWTAIYLVAGLAVLFLGAEAMIRGAAGMARAFGITEAVIGLTIVAVGTSLPELATSLVAAFRRQSDIAIGNVVGSNIFNILGILGITAVVTPVGVAENFARFDVPVMLGASLVFAVILVAGRTIGRPIALGLLVCYGAYMCALFG